MSENQDLYRIGFDEYQTTKGQTCFAEYIKSTENFLKSKGVSNEDAKDLSQNIAVKILEKLEQNQEFKADCGYFINFAKNTLKENYKRISNNQNRFVDIGNEDNFETTNHPTDIKNLTDYENRNSNLHFHECILECFQSLNQDQQIMLYRYSYKPDEHSLGESMKNNNFIGDFLDFLKETTKQFFSFGNNYNQMTTEEKAQKRLTVHRLREKLVVCVKGCVSRKKGLG